MVINLLASMMRQVGRALGLVEENSALLEEQNKKTKITRTKIESLSKVANDQLLLEAINHHDLAKLNAWIDRINSLIEEKLISSKTGINIPINVVENSKTQNSAQSTESFPLILAAASKNDDLTLIERLLEEGADPYLKDSHKVSALMAAACVGAKQKFTRLLSVSTKDIEEHLPTIVQYIVLGDKPEILQIFADYVKILPSDFYDNLHTLAIKQNAKKIYQYILSKPFAKPNMENILK